MDEACVGKTSLPAMTNGDVPADGSNPVVFQVTPGPTAVVDPLGGSPPTIIATAG
jgi:hypothetical protein